MPRSPPGGGTPALRHRRGARRPVRRALRGRLTGPGARTDANFDPAGQDLLAGLLLAAALDHRPLTDVYAWLTRPTDEMAIDVLREHSFPLNADQVAGVVAAPEKQRGGVFGTAQQTASCLTSRQDAARSPDLPGQSGAVGLEE